MKTYPKYALINRTITGEYICTRTFDTKKRGNAMACRISRIRSSSNAYEVEYLHG